MVELNGDRIGSRLEDFSNFAAGENLLVPEEDAKAVLVGQLAERAFQELPPLPGFGRERTVGLCRLIFKRVNPLPLEALSAEEVPQPILTDPENPVSEGPSAIVRSKAS